MDGSKDKELKETKDQRISEEKAIAEIFAKHLPFFEIEKINSSTGSCIITFSTYAAAAFLANIFDVSESNPYKDTVIPIKGNNKAVSIDSPRLIHFFNHVELGNLSAVYLGFCKEKILTDLQTNLAFTTYLTTQERKGFIKQINTISDIDSFNKCREEIRSLILPRVHTHTLRT